MPPPPHSAECENHIHSCAEYGEQVITSFAPNGNVLAVNDSSNGTWTYSYDQFNRLTGATQNNGASVYSYVYDRFGNRWQQNGPHTFTATFTGNNPSNPANNNRIDGYTYDAAGNLIADGTHTYTYDAENRLIKVDGGNTSTFTYDGEGHRASKTNSSSINSGGDTPDPIGTTEFVYDPQGHLVHTESPNTGGGWRGEVFAGNRHLATYAGGSLIFAHSDWLGTERNRDLPNSNAPQYPSNQNITSLPFGDWLDNTQGIFNDWTPLNFTGQYHDFETDLDYFGARYYAPTTGRFTSSDPGNAGADIGAPQSWNAYSYVLNNPVNLTDPLGLCGGEGSIPDLPCPNDNTVNVSAWEGGWNAWLWFFQMQQTTSVTLPGQLTPPTQTSSDNSSGFWNSIKNAARKVGNYIPLVCSGGVYNNAGVGTSGPLSVGVSPHFQQADFGLSQGKPYATYSEGVFVEASRG